MGDTKIEHFFYILISDHVVRNFRLFQKYAHDIWILQEGKWSLVKCPFLKTKLFFARSFIFRKIFLKIIDKNTVNFYDNYLAESIREMRQIAEKKYGSKLTVVIFPGYDTKIEGDILLLPQYIEENKTNDGYHPSAYANEETAKLLYKHISETDI